LQNIINGLLFNKFKELFYTGKRIAPENRLDKVNIFFKYRHNTVSCLSTSFIKLLWDIKPIRNFFTKSPSGDIKLTEYEGKESPNVDKYRNLINYLNCVFHYISSKIMETYQDEVPIVVQDLESHCTFCSLGKYIYPKDEDNEIINFGQIDPNNLLLFIISAFYNFQELKTLFESLIMLEISAKTGIAPRDTTAAAVATAVCEGRMTSSPIPMPSDFNPITNASVPEFTPMQN
jgi:hypothetical protein